jgi:uncharacterized protein YcbK (DUF882 family)
MRRIFAAIIFAALFSFPAQAWIDPGGPDSRYVVGKGYVEPAPRYRPNTQFGTYTQAPRSVREEQAKAQRRAPARAPAPTTEADCSVSSSSPDSVYIPNVGYRDRACTTLPKRRGLALDDASARATTRPRASAQAKAKPAAAKERTVYTYARDSQGQVTGLNSASASCLPSTVKDRLTEIERRFGKVTIISAFRKGARIAGSGSPSLHASCRAVDFKVARNQSAAAAWLKANHAGGVGTYTCAMHHIHIDDGRRARWHQCVNKSGRPVRRRS